MRSVLVLFLLLLAQRPAEKPWYTQVDKDALVIGRNPDRSWVLSPAFYRAIEQHCVAILTEQHDEKHIGLGETQPIYVEPAPVVHVPEKVLKLRCTSEAK